MTAVFVHHDGALGDVLLSLPCLDHLRFRYGPVHLATRAAAARLLTATGCVQEASSLESARYLSLYTGQADAQARRLLTGFERAFVFSVNKAPAVYSAVRAVVPQATLIRTVPPDEERTHVAEFRLAQLGVPALNAHRSHLAVPRGDRDRAAAWLSRTGVGGGRPLLAVHPGSGGTAKCWPLDGYLALAARAQAKRGAFIVMITGPDEREDLVRAVASYCRSTIYAVHLADADLPMVAAVLSHADAYAGNDSGVSHLAAVAGCPCVVLFGPTDPARWRPSGPSVSIVSARSMPDITVDRVSRAVFAVMNGRAVPAGAEALPA